MSSRRRVNEKRVGKCAKTKVKGTKVANVLLAQGKSKCRVRMGVAIIFMVHRETLIGKNPMRKSKNYNSCVLFVKNINCEDEGEGHWVVTRYPLLRPLYRFDGVG